MTTYTWTDNAMQGGTACDVDKVNDNLMHLKYDTSGGICKFNPLGTISGNFSLNGNFITTGDVSGNYALSLPTVTDTEKQVVCIFDFTTTNASYPTINASNLKWSDKNGGKCPSAYSIVTGVRNILTFKSIWVNGTLYWEADYSTYGGVERTFTQPTLGSNGTLGGNAFAVSATNIVNNYYAFFAADNNSSTIAAWPQGQPYSYTWYNPSPLKVSSILITSADMNPSVPNGYTLYGSNDNNNFTVLTTGTNSNGTYLNIAVPLANQNFYNYYKIYVSSSAGSQNNWTQATLTATYITT